MESNGNGGGVPEKRQTNVIINSEYSLDKYIVNGKRDDKDPENYLYKNGKMCFCPYMSSMGVDPRKNTLQLDPNKINVVPLSSPCGTFCLHFHLFKETKKVPQRENPQDEKSPVKEVLTETGRLRAAITCGAGNVSFVIGNMSTNSNLSESNLKVTKSPA